MLTSQVVSKLAARREAEQFRSNYTTALTRPPAKKRKSTKKTAAEKEAMAAKRAERQEEYSKALQEARDVVNEHAKRLHAQFGGHSIEYYQQEIIQVSRKSLSQRGPNGYSIYLRSKLAELNACT